MGALSKLDEFLLNPQVRTCSVAVQGTSGNANSENRETHGDRSSNDPYPEVGYFLHHSGQLNSPETETYPHMVTENYPHSYHRKIKFHDNMHAIDCPIICILFYDLHIALINEHVLHKLYFCMSS